MDCPLHVTYLTRMRVAKAVVPAWPEQCVLYHPFAKGDGYGITVDGDVVRVKADNGSATYRVVERRNTILFGYEDDSIDLVLQLVECSWSEPDVAPNTAVDFFFGAGYNLAASHNRPMPKSA